MCKKLKETNSSFFHSHKRGAFDENEKTAKQMCPRVNKVKMKHMSSYVSPTSMSQLNVTLNRYAFEAASEFM